MQRYEIPFIKVKRLDACFYIDGKLFHNIGSLNEKLFCP